MNKKFEVVKTPTIMELGGFWNVYMEFTVPLSMIRWDMAYIVPRYTRLTPP